MAKSPAPARGAAQTRKGARWGLWLIAILAAAAGIAAYAYREPIRGYGGIAAAYSARVGCSCRYVAGRDLKDCKRDKVAGMELVTMVEDEETRSVTARFPLVAKATATYREGYGCVLEPWEG